MFSKKMIFVGPTKEDCVVNNRNCCKGQALSEQNAPKNTFFSRKDRELNKTRDKICMRISRLKSQKLCNPICSRRMRKYHVVTFFHSHFYGCAPASQILRIWVGKAGAYKYNNDICTTYVLPFDTSLPLID